MAQKDPFEIDIKFSIDPKKSHNIKINMADRESWGAAAPSRPAEPQALPVTALVVHYDSGVEPCHNDEECGRTLRELQKKHMEQGLPDIAYNFLIGGHGTIYEGTGWNHKSWKLGEKYAHLDGTSYDIAYIGRWSLDDRPYTFMVEACLNWVNHAVLSYRMHRYFHLIEESSPSDFVPRMLDPRDF